MLIKRVLNNNTVFSEDNKGQEIIVAGLGVGFQKKKGDSIEQKKIERVFTLSSKVLHDLLFSVPKNHMKMRMI